MQNAFERDISKLFSVKKFPTSTKWELVKLPLEFKPIRVRSCHFYCGLQIYAAADLVQQGISEKVALVVNFISAFITGFVLAYARSWRLALALSTMFPCIAIAGGVLNKAMSGYIQ